MQVLSATTSNKKIVKMGKLKKEITQIKRNSKKKKPKNLINMIEQKIIFYENIYD